MFSMAIAKVAEVSAAIPNATAVRGASDTSSLDPVCRD
jgi:hypothetical protein